MLPRIGHYMEYLIGYCDAHSDRSCLRPRFSRGLFRTDRCYRVHAGERLYRAIVLAVQSEIDGAVRRGLQAVQPWYAGKLLNFVLT